MTDFHPSPFSAGRRQLCIAVVSDTYPPEVNGVAMTARQMVQGLARHGHTVQLVRPRQEMETGETRGMPVEELLVRSIPLPGYRGLRLGLPAAGELLRQWKTRRPDLIQIATESPLGWSALATAKKLRIPAISEFHTNFHNYSQYYRMGALRGPIHAYLRWFHNRAQCTLVPTEALRHELDGSGFRNLQVLSRGVDTSLFDPARRSPELRHSWNVQESRLAVLSVGRIAPEKNLPVLIETFRRMQAARPGMKLVMVGDGPERAAMQAAHPDVIFTGIRGGEDLAAHYASADIFLFPSVTETFGNVVIEAMSSGLAVLAYDHAAAHEYIRHDFNGLRASLNDPRSFSTQALRLASFPQEVRRLGQNARLSMNELSWDKIHQRFAQLATNLIQKWEKDHDGKHERSIVPNP